MLNDHISNSPQLLATFFLFLKQLSSPTYISGVQLSQNILAVWLDCLTGDDFLADSSLDDDLEELPLDMFLKFGDPNSSLSVHLAKVHDSRNCIDGFFVDQEL